MARAGTQTPREDRGLKTDVGTQVEVDWPRSLGFFGAIGAATALELIPFPIALFVASVPFVKLLNRPNAPKATRFFSQVMDGASKPVGGDSEGTIHWTSNPGRKASARGRRRASRKKGGSR